jgi:hypothetical protein
LAGNQHENQNSNETSVCYVRKRHIQIVERALCYAN